MEDTWRILEELRREFEALMRAPNSEENSLRRKQIIAEISAVKKLRAKGEIEEAITIKGRENED